MHRIYRFLLVGFLLVLGIITPLLFFYDWGNEVNILLQNIFIYVSIIILFFSLLFYIYLESNRIKKIKKIAKKYNLKYTDYQKMSKQQFPYQKNILKGRINNKEINIFDYYERIFDETASLYTKKSTVLVINDDLINKKEFTGFLNGLLSVKKLDKILADLKNQ